MASDSNTTPAEEAAHTSTPCSVNTEKNLKKPQSGKDNLVPQAQAATEESSQAVNPEEALKTTSIDAAMTAGASQAVTTQAIVADDTHKSTSQDAKAPAGETHTATTTQPGSWGDDYKSISYDLGMFGGINYVINTALSALGIAYQFERRAAEPINRFSEQVGTKIGQVTGLKKASAIAGTSFGVRAFFLTSGGTALLGIIKKGDENRNRIEYNTSEAYDRLQEKMGKGNDATRYNIELYDLVKDVSEKRKRGEQAELDPEIEKELRRKHCITIEPNGDLTFKEVKQNWPDLLKTRSFAIASAVGLNYLLGLTKGNVKDPQVIAQYGKYGKGFGQIERYGTPVIANVFEKTPILRSMADKELAANILLNDSILTAASAGTHFGMHSNGHGEKEDDCSDIPFDYAKSSPATAAKKDILAKGKPSESHVAKTAQKQPETAATRA